MENKEPIRVSLSTTICLIIIALLIAALGAVCYLGLIKNAQEITQLSTENQNLQEQVATLEKNEKSNITEETETEISTVNTNENTENSESLTNSQAKTIIQNYLDLLTEADVSALLSYLSEKGDLGTYEGTESNSGDIITNIKFSDYKKAMLNYVSEDEFERNWYSTLYLSENSNGFVTIPVGGGLRNIYTVNDISEIEELTYKADVTSSSEDGSNSANVTYEFKLKKVNGIFVVDSFDGKYAGL